MKENKRAKAFWKRLKELSEDKSEKCWLEWEVERVEYSKMYERCLCGQPIRWRFKLKNKVNGKRTIIGQCCAKRIGFALCWRSKEDYLNSALLLARNEWEMKFVRSLLDKLPKWGGSLRISMKQKRILERITNHKWRWPTWEDYH